MPKSRLVSSFVLAALCTSTVAAQSTREAAVAIDRMTVPANNPMDVELIGPPMASPWSLAFLPDGSFLISEKHGSLVHMSADGRMSRLEGGPTDIFAEADSGLLDVVLDPDFADNAIVYLAYAQGNADSNRTAIWSAKFDGTRVTDGRVIFRSNFDKQGPSHPGGRMLFLPDKSLLLTVGDGFDYRDQAQDRQSHLGKVLRLMRDGSAAPDNPFAADASYASEIWTLGHRNIQGLTLDTATNRVWSHEHGPRGGDEVNELTAGSNYGWPLLSSGIDYDGSIITDRAHAPGYQAARFVWAPSIAPSGLAIYHGPRFPDWNGRILIGALAARSLTKLRVGAKTGLLVEEARLLGGLDARIRDVRVARDGNIYLLTDGDQGRLIRLVPADSPTSIASDSPLEPIGFLVGRWDSDSRFLPPFRADATPTLANGPVDCQPNLQGQYIRCVITLRRADGRTRMMEHHIQRSADDKGFDVVLFNSSVPDQGRYMMAWDDEAKAFVAIIPTEVANKAATEKVTISVSEDRQRIEHREAVRLDSDHNGPWTETFRWTWKRRP